jgi:signal transduction histidine kinase
VGEDIDLKLTLAPDLWKVQADPGYIEQVLMNLCANARDAMPEGGRLEISTTNHLVTEDETAERVELHCGPYIVLTVSDSGAGVPENIRSQIFEPFFTTKEQGHGTGLGLATVYGIVKQSGGGIYVESQPGKGTKFTVYLPRAEEDTKELGARSQELG